MKLGIVDEVIKEPLGGAHRDNERMAEEVKKSILNNLKSFQNLSGEEIYNERKMKFLKIGRDQGFKTPSQSKNLGLRFRETSLFTILKDKKAILFGAIIFMVLAIFLMF